MDAVNITSGVWMTMSSMPSILKVMTPFQLEDIWVLNQK